MATVYTRTPEQQRGDETCTEGTDIWALGVMIWIKLAGDFPFLKDAEDLKDERKVTKLLKAEHRFGITWNGRGISTEARTFVKNCLKLRPEDRWSAKEALEYLLKTWMPATKYNTQIDMNDESISTKRDECEISEIVKVEYIERFSKYGKMKKTVLAAMAYSLDRADVDRLREIFLVADSDDTGTISFKDLRAAFEKVDPTAVDDELVADIFEGLDQDSSGQIHYAEFLAALAESHGLVTYERLAEAFDRFDSDGKGYISHDDLKKILGKDYDKDVVDGMIKEADFKNNGQIDYEELLRLMFDEDISEGDKCVGDVKESLKREGIEDTVKSSFRNLDGIKIAWPKEVLKDVVTP
eukprot:CAMPEP_0113311620 /NCGR_PEP_ID=MMETSP0010_2-20120614/8781_1 /TAXON_ID=216773 ORGANISM="Corethron hystrix, Strain 308" /NCGR_SAMPLE_ID=MMETSP0010_2 /ASSEMBLY_ACC=CAM_ASM_000155 /LENGTH=353 /DNA_ID=CAMNT_0000167289 /DNA_START=919 /DNA_END=1980 /DNA_ORIENTATION=+ /assembly_acc=CAM_ASM_000155